MFTLKNYIGAALAIGSTCAAVVDVSARSADVQSVCEQIADNISSASDVIYPLALNFQSDIHHWFASSTQTPTCVLEAGSAEDVATAIKIIGENRTPFAVRSGGHTSNPGFSSTTGVHITFSKMTQVTLSADKSTVEIEMGQTWSSVYEALQGSGYNVVGGRTIGPGVGGFSLGGGFSWKTNQFGLTSDTVQSFNLVLPNGTITTVDSSTPDLFFALKGGLNRFGIVTSAVYKAHPQTNIYGGLNTYGTEQIPAVLNATTAFFEQNTDPKAQIITTLQGSATGPTCLGLFFYDAPTKPSSFDLFDNIPTLTSTVGVQTFSSLVQNFPATLEVNVRGTFHTLSTTGLTLNFLNAVLNETNYFGSVSTLHGGSTMSYDIEPFLTNYGQYDTNGAWPHSNSPLPLNLYFSWELASEDAFWYAQMIESVERLKAVAISEGIYSEDLALYTNYAISNTTAEQLYGATNLARLRSIQAEVDPTGIMGLAGGFTL